MTIILTSRIKFILLLSSAAIVIACYFINKMIKTNSGDKKKIESTLITQSIPQTADTKKGMDQKSTEPNPYIIKYAGTYTIKVKGDNSGNDEVLKLESNRDCTWIFGNQKKYGKWTASEKMIQTLIRGNSGDIPENFLLKNGMFVSTDSDARYLKKELNK